MCRRAGGQADRRAGRPSRQTGGQEGRAGRQRSGGRDGQTGRAWEREALPAPVRRAGGVGLAKALVCLYRHNAPPRPTPPRPTPPAPPRPNPHLEPPGTWRRAALGSLSSRSTVRELAIISRRTSVLLFAALGEALRRGYCGGEGPQGRLGSGRGGTTASAPRRGNLRSTFPVNKVGGKRATKRKNRELRQGRRLP